MQPREVSSWEVNWNRPSPRADQRREGFRGAQTCFQVGAVHVPPTPCCVDGHAGPRWGEAGRDSSLVSGQALDLA